MTTNETQGLRRLQDRLWPGFLFVGLGVLALWWHRTRADESSILATVVLFAVPVLLAAGVLLLLRALKLKEQAAADRR